MEVINGSVVTDSQDEILEALISDAEQYFGTEFSESENKAVRHFYIPVAGRLQELQEQSSVILESTQIDNAQGTALDLLCALIGVTRFPPSRSTGTATFYRDTASDVRDYNIPQGTMVRTDGEDPIIFETTEAATLEQGNTRVHVPIEALETGSASNVSANNITVIRENISGIDGVYNVDPTEGGRDEEEDDELRERAKEDLAEGASSTANALITSVGAVEEVNSVQIFFNEGDMGTMPGWELVVHGGPDDEIGQAIVDKMAAGDTAYGGIHGSAVQSQGELNNGQTQSVQFSRPDVIDIYVDIEIDVEEGFPGGNEVGNSVTEYIGGTVNNGSIVDGDITVGDDVIYGAVEYAIRSVEGVYDVTTLNIGTSESPSGTSNLTIQDFEVAETNATENINVTVNEL